MILSDNMRETVSKSSTIRKMFEVGTTMKGKYGAENVYDFSLGNPVAPVPEEVKKSIIRVMTDLEPLKVHGYMKNSGYEEVRQKIADSLNGKYGTDYSFENIIMTVGAAGGINTVLRAILNPEDEIMAFAPFFSEYRSYAANFQGKVNVVPAKTDDFQLDIDKAEELITDRTKAVIVNNPNNPSGALYSEDTIKALGEMIKRAEKRFGHPIIVIADEPYRELVYDGKEIPFIPNIINNTIFAYSFSKTLSIPGERIGYLAIRNNVDEYKDLIQGLTISNRILVVNAPSLLQFVAADCIDVKADVEFYDRNRKLLYKELTRIGFECVKPEGAFYMLVKSPLESAEAFTEKAKDLHIIFSPTDSFALPGYVRLAYCVDYRMIERSIPAFEKLAESLHI